MCLYVCSVHVKPTLQNADSRNRFFCHESVGTRGKSGGKTTTTKNSVDVGPKLELLVVGKALTVCVVETEGATVTAL